MRRPDPARRSCRRPSSSTSGERNLQVVYFRYSYDDSCRCKPLSALRSIVLQLRSIAQQQRPAVSSIPEQAAADYAQETGVHHAYALHDEKLASKVALAFLRKEPRVHIIVDGLDECNDVNGALRLLLGLAASLPHGLVKWFFTSRDEPAIRAAMTLPPPWQAGGCPSRTETCWHHRAAAAPRRRNARHYAFPQHAKRC